jgi:hypothetical protein
VAFTDDDCVPQPGWLATLVRTVQNGVDIAQGSTRPDQEQWQGRGPFSHTVWVMRDKGFYETCNIAYRREVLERVGGFDERFRYRTGGARIRPIFGEDADLGWRAIESGATAAFVPEAVVHHAVWPSSYREHVRAMRRREGVPLMLSRHPQLRRSLHHHVFQEPTHPWAALAFASIVAAAGPRRRAPLARVAVALAGFLPYAVMLQRVRPMPARKRLVYLIPMELAAELVEIGVCVTGSIRHRTLVL